MPNPENKQKEIPRVEYSQKELDYRGFLITRANSSRSQREQNFDEFDGQTFEQYYFSNAKAKNSYIEPKKNDEDVRVVTGTTKEKNNTMIASTLNYNLEPEVTAFDEDDTELVDLGIACKDMIRKSKKLELPEYEMKRPVIYDEYYAQGTVHVLETYDEYTILRKEMPKMDWSEGVDPNVINWNEKLKDTYKYCNSSMVSGLHVYPGNVREFFIELQPYMIIRRKRHRSEVEAQYGTWPRWKYVPRKIEKFLQDSTVLSDSSSANYDDWSMVETSENMVEEVLYFDKWKNEYQILLNGVMMLPVGFPLSFFLGIPEYPISKGDCEPISRFFYWSKSIPAKTKVDQQIFDEFMKMAIVKTRKSFKAPIFNNTGQNLTTKIFEPGTIHKNIDASKIIEFGKTDGVTAPEFNMINMVKGIIDSKSVSPVFEGQAMTGDQTAREIIELKQQGMMKMGLAIVGIVNLERRMAWLRLYNILKNWSEPLEESFSEVKGKIKKYRRISVDADFGDGEKGNRMIEFTEDMPTSEMVAAREKIVKDTTGKNIREIYINAKDLKALKYKFFVEIVPTEKSTSELKKALFIENMTQGLQLFGPAAFNMEFLKRQWVSLAGQDPEKMLVVQPSPEQQMMMEQQAQVGAQGPQNPGGPEGGNQLGLNQQMSPMQSKTNAPSLSALA
jgi:hypothetical protein